MRIATRAQALAPCQRSPYTGKPHEWEPMPPHLAATAPEPVAFYCKWDLLVIGQKLLDEMGAA